MKFVLFGVIVLIVIAGAVFAYGASLPVEVKAERTQTLNAPVDKVYAIVSDVAGQAAWRSDVGNVRMSADGRSWTEETKQGVTIAFEEVARTPPTRFEIDFTSPQGFSGRWVGVFAPTPDGKTQITFTETVRTESPIGRLMQQIFAPPGAHIDLYLKDLDAALRVQAR
jgi:hypothetical protein